MPNAKVLESKKTVVDALSDKIQNATAAVFVDYKGITVAQDTELRNQFRAAGVEYSVVKNTLTRRQQGRLHRVRRGSQRHDVHGFHHRRSHCSGSRDLRIRKEKQERRQDQGRHG